MCGTPPDCWNTIAKTQNAPGRDRRRSKSAGRCESPGGSLEDPACAAGIAYDSSRQNANAIRDDCHQILRIITDLLPNLVKTPHEPHSETGATAKPRWRH